MNDIRIGACFRALRHRLQWRQDDLAQRSGISQDFISLVERGRIDRMPLAKLRRVASELDAELAVQLRWRGGDLDRLIDEGHARLVGRTAEALQVTGWRIRPEVSYSIYGERGSIDLLAWHAASRLLLVVEVKTELVAVEQTLRKHDEKVRLASRIAEKQLGWRATTAARLLVLPDLSTPRRRVDRHAPVMQAAYPLRGVALRRWLGKPDGPAAGLLFVGVSTGKARLAGGVISQKRIRAPREAA